MKIGMTERKNLARDRAALYRANHPAFAEWAKGYGPIRHSDQIQVRVYKLAQLLVERGAVSSADEVYERLRAADRLACAGMWLVVHMTYAQRVYTDGRQMQAEDFKPVPEGHTGGALNMVPAYVGYLTLNSLTGMTRSWMMGQGHCVAAIDSLNLLVDNMLPEHAARYNLSDEGLTRLVQDFYSYKILPDGRPESPLGSHVNAYTAGGLIEGGYLGFAELQYVHMPLPGERLVAFLSDGAFEEQRGSDWMSRWWRAEDCGLVTPVMIANGRRIDQQTSMGRPQGLTWFRNHLELNGFAPVEIDGTDPAAFVVGIFEAEEILQAASLALQDGRAQYPVPLPYVIAETLKGWGFPGADTNAAHNLPLVTNPAKDENARRHFNAGAQLLHVPLPELKEAVAQLNRHDQQQRPKERDHALAKREVKQVHSPDIQWAKGQEPRSPMDGVDQYFCDLVDANPELRVRVGNPDEMRSNRLNQSLDKLKHRVLSPEEGIAESLDGSVITALNEEAVVSAALANKAGLNLVASYEAFTVKMLGAVRQEIIFARHQKEAGRAPGWVSVPVISTSHTWENGKNEQSHQDPIMAEAMLGEMADVSRVLFPVDWNSAVAAMDLVYQTRGALFNLVIPKRPQPNWLTPEQARQLAQDGVICVHQEGSQPGLQILAVGAYQLGEALKASKRLAKAGVAHAVYCLLEPGRFRAPRDAMEAEFCTSTSMLGEHLAGTRILISHTRAEVMTGTLWPLVRSCDNWVGLGYRNRGGTLDEPGMLYANRCSWAHVLKEYAQASQSPLEALLSAEEIAALEGTGDPRLILYANI